MLVRSSSLPHDAIIKLPPEEKGDIALLCAPKTVHANSDSAPSPVEAASAGISGKSAGATTPVVELTHERIPEVADIIGTAEFAVIRLER